MPLFIQESNIKWHETKHKLIIIIPLHERIDTKTSIVTTSQYLKVNSPPWLWECFLFAAIDPTESYVRIENEAVSFELKKAIPEFWKDLENSNKSLESFRREQRQKAYEENEKRLKETAEGKAKKQQEIHSASVRKQMELDKRERDLVEKEKKAENERVAADMERMKREQLRANSIAEKRRHILKKSQEIPPTRKSGHIIVNFTPRVFPTAARESKEVEEREWLEKQAEASVSLKLDCSDLSPNERNPEWLKTKAETMFKRGDYRSAVNAYNLSIRMCPNLYSLYLGRSACHFHLRNLHKCIEDSSKALELLVPPVPSNARDRIEAHRIRGKAFHQLELPVEGLMDLEAALKIDPHDEDIRENAIILRNIVQESC